jgi:MFS family permease
VAIGPILGSFHLVHYWWGSVFLINVPIAALGGLAAIFLVPNSRNVRAKPLDPVGMVLSILGFGLLLWAIIEAPGRTWTAPRRSAPRLSEGWPDVGDQLRMAA